MLEKPSKTNLNFSMKSCDPCSRMNHLAYQYLWKMSTSTVVEQGNRAKNINPIASDIPFFFVVVSCVLVMGQLLNVPIVDAVLVQEPGFDRRPKTLSERVINGKLLTRRYLMYRSAHTKRCVRKLQTLFLASLVCKLNMSNHRMPSFCINKMLSSVMSTRKGVNKSKRSCTRTRQPERDMVCCPRCQFGKNTY
jgi:hypothetical protein